MFQNVAHRRSAISKSGISQRHEKCKNVGFTGYYNSKREFLSAIFFQFLPRFSFLKFKVWHVVKASVQILTHCKFFRWNIWFFVDFCIPNLTHCKNFLPKCCVSKKQGKCKNCRFLGVTWFITSFLNATFFQNLARFKFLIQNLTRCIILLQNLTHRKILTSKSCFSRKHDWSKIYRFHGVKLIKNCFFAWNLSFKISQFRSMSLQNVKCYKGFSSNSVAL